MSPVSGLSPLWVGIAAIGLGLVVVLWVVLRPDPTAAARRRIGAVSDSSLLSRSAEGATKAVGSVLARGQRSLSWERALDRAGVKATLPEFVLLVGVAMLVGLAVGLLIGSLVVGILLAGFAVAGAVMLVTFRADRRRAEFADQLDDILMLLASNLRAGHSLPQSLDSLTHDIEDPAAGEIARAVTQVRVGRDLSEALADVAERLDSDDFRWIVQAIAIHRQVGGNLSEVLDTVADTIRSRGQLRRQVAALSAEGKLSAWVLIALPFFVVLALSFLNPDYLGVLTASTLGFLMIGAASILLVVGIFWMRAVVKVEF